MQEDLHQVLAGSSDLPESARGQDQKKLPEGVGFGWKPSDKQTERDIAQAEYRDRIIREAVKEARKPVAASKPPRLGVGVGEGLQRLLEGVKWNLGGREGPGPKDKDYRGSPGIGESLRKLIMPEKEVPPDPFNVNANAAQPVSFADIVPEYVERKTGSKVAGFVAGMATPSPSMKLGGNLSELIKGQKIFRGSYKPAEHISTVSRRLDEPGHELGMHVSTDSKTAELFTADFMRESSKNQQVLYEMRSNVGKPLVVKDTSAAWTPEIVIDSIKESGSKFSKEGFSKLDSIEKEYQGKISAFYSDPELKKKYRFLSNYVKEELDSVYGKRIQKVIKDEGYDHISYTNLVEGKPSESAILFDKGDFVLDKVENFSAPKNSDDILSPEQMDKLIEIDYADFPVKSQIDDVAKAMEQASWTAAQRESWGAMGKDPLSFMEYQLESAQRSAAKFPEAKGIVKRWVDEIAEFKKVNKIKD